MSTSLDLKVNDFLSQRRIAVAGVSRTLNSPNAANGIYRRFREMGYEVFAINPNADQVEGDVCYHDLKSIPGGVDAVIIATRPDATDNLVRDCVEVGVRHVWMHDGIHSLGSSVSDDAVEFCNQHNISVIAGACPLMFGKPSDGFHRFMKGCIGLVGHLPN
jgi:predicted CoA-binding protein